MRVPRARAAQSTSKKSSLIPAFGIVVLLVLAMLWVGGCSDGDATATSVTSSSISAGPESDSTQTTSQTDGLSAGDGALLEGASGEQRFVVGGQSAEEYEKSLPSLEEKVAAEPSNTDLLLDLAVAYYNLNRFEEAAATYEKLLALADDAFTRNNYGNVLRDWGKTDEAKAAYLQAIATDKTLITPYLNLVTLCVKEGDIETAKAAVKQGVAAMQGEDKAKLEQVLTQLEDLGKK